jgi:hypothetical protein
MRAVVNVLAVLVLVVGAGCALGNLAIMILAMDRAVVLQARMSADFPVFALVLLGACLCTIGATMAYRSWNHLRAPDAATARDVISFALLWIFFAGLTPLLRHHPYLAMLAALSLVLIRHFLIKRLTPRFAGIH